MPWVARLVVTRSITARDCPYLAANSRGVMNLWKFGLVGSTVEATNASSAGRFWIASEMTT